MYHSRIEAAVDVSPMTAEGSREGVHDARTKTLGVLILIVGLPVLFVRVLLWAVARDIRRIGTVAGIIGQSYTDVMRHR